MALPNRSAWPRWARVVSSAWVLSPFLVFALLIGTFFAYGAYTRSQPTHYARGGDDFAAVVPDSPSPSPVARNKKHQAQPKTAAGMHDAAVVTTGGTSTSHTAGQSSTGGHTSTPTTTSTGVVYPAAGTYQLQVDGQEHVKFGPFSACTNT